MHVCRHGEVDNPHGILYERLPGYHLSPLGRDMAQALADHFTEANADIAAIITSPLERAKETAQPTAQAFGLPISTDDDLIEAANKFSGMTVHANYAALAHPRMWSRYVNPLRPSWGEPYRHQARRMASAVRRALAKGYGHEVVVVSHQLPIWCLRLFLEGRVFAHLPSQRECALASVTSLTFDGHTLVGLTYDEPAAHLLPMARDVTPGRSAADINSGD